MFQPLDEFFSLPQRVVDLMEVAIIGEQSLYFLGIDGWQSFWVHSLRAAYEIVGVELGDRLYSADLAEILEDGMRDSLECSLAPQLEIA